MGGSCCCFLDGVFTEKNPSFKIALYALAGGRAGVGRLASS